MAHPSTTLWASVRLAPVLLLLTLPVQAQEEVDPRIPVRLPEDDRAHLLEDMRYFLERSTDLLAAVAARDLPEARRIAEAAKPPLARARSLAAGTQPPPMAGPGDATRMESAARFRRMQQNLPQGFRDLLLDMRLGLAAVAEAAAADDAGQSLRHLVRVQQTCVACHRSYRLAEAAGGG